MVSKAKTTSQKEHRKTNFTYNQEFGENILWTVPVISAIKLTQHSTGEKKHSETWWWQYDGPHSNSTEELPGRFMV